MQLIICALLSLFIISNISIIIISDIILIILNITSTDHRYQYRPILIIKLASLLSVRYILMIYWPVIG
jgi:hypothetical protein